MKPQAGLKTPLHRSDWTTARLKFYLQRHARPTKEDEGVVTAFRDGVVTLRSNRREDGFTFADKEIGYQGVEPGDLVIHAMDGFAGAIGVSDSRGKCSPVYSIVTPRQDDSANTRFWAYYLRNLATTGFIQSLAKGIRERSTDFRWNDASNLLVNFPPPETQRAIADFLDRETARIDQLIQKKQRLAQLLEERRKAEISHAVTGGFENHLPRGETGNSYYRKLPQGWKPAAIKRIALILYGIAEPPLYREEGTPLIRATNVKSGYIERRGLVLIDPSDIPGDRAVRLRQGDIIVVRSGALTGDSAIITQDFAGSIAGFDMVVRSFKVNPYFLQYCLLSKDLKDDQIELLRQRAAQLHLNAKELGSCFIPLPPPEVQDKIVALLDRQKPKFRGFADKTTTSIDRLREFRSALITAAVTGQIDVNEWSRRGRTDAKLDAIAGEMEAGA